MTKARYFLEFLLEGQGENGIGDPFTTSNKIRIPLRTYKSHAVKKALFFAHEAVEAAMKNNANFFQKYSPNIDLDSEIDYSCTDFRLILEKKLEI